MSWGLHFSLHTIIKWIFTSATQIRETKPCNTCLPVAPPLPRSTVHAFCLFVIFITLRQATTPFKKLPGCSLFLTPRTVPEIRSFLISLTHLTGIATQSNINILVHNYTVQNGATFMLSIWNMAYPSYNALSIHEWMQLIIFHCKQKSQNNLVYGCKTSETRLACQNNVIQPGPMSGI